MANQSMATVKKGASVKTATGKTATAPVAKPAAKTIRAKVPAGTSSKRSRLRERTGEDRLQMIATAAYYRAELRGFNGGDPVADWLAAEAEIDSMRYC